ncbi:MAG: hypothetical protein LBG77_01770 [Dysgonamonadaceae bacterium]|jgi:hypothetical protein|nr:hypothetical protein [Dysgonamonadaceae bacterium]
MNGIPLINGQTYSWGDIICTIAGIPVTGITAIEYSDSQEMQENYGAGRYPVSRSKGRIACTGKITLYPEEVIAISNKAINSRLQDIAAFTIVVSYIPTEGGIPVHDKLNNCQFKANSRAWAEGDMSKPVELELMVSDITWGKTE